jgi:hypothetical protein
MIPLIIGTDTGPNCTHTGWSPYFIPACVSLQCFYMIDLSAMEITFLMYSNLCFFDLTLFFSMGFSVSFFNNHLSGC